MTIHGHCHYDSIARKQNLPLKCIGGRLTLLIHGRSLIGHRKQLAALRYTSTFKIIAACATRKFSACLRQSLSDPSYTSTSSFLAELIDGRQTGRSFVENAPQHSLYPSVMDRPRNCECLR